jgi:hypothetical protein
VNCRNRCLEWPPGLEPSYSVVQEIPIAREVLCPSSRPDRQYNNEIATREAAFIKEDQRRAFGRQISSFQTILRYTHHSDTKDSLKRITEELTNVTALEKGAAQRRHSLDIRNERSLTKETLELETAVYTRILN